MEEKERGVREANGRHICHRRWAKKTTRPRVSGAEEPAVNSRPIKRTNKLLSEKKLTARCRHRRHERIADHSLPNANYLYSAAGN
ncbi:hypothetical protein DBV15_05747 [Temnothorax longispinosus]|uniref:Uncharacterized protein n=1 Tax=Temnothorax longispinosus TaxID=300112 RepID=A0A4S2KK22_9HYME|nr:hypothetical protein DBV15_05747 [Temnothorax longispinosus]